MQSEFIPYQKFTDAVLANALIEQLDEHGIEYLTDEEIGSFDTSMSTIGVSIRYVVKIKSEDFEYVNAQLKADDATHLEGIEDDYYLFDFTNHELKELIAYPDEYSDLDIVIARRILAKRGKI
jgi:hypothetical protein